MWLFATDVLKTNYGSLDEQVEIVFHINSMLSIEESVGIHLDTEILKSEILCHSILKEAFSGRLVEQDWNDEPAYILLERIRADKATQGKTKKNNKAKRRTA